MIETCIDCGNIPTPPNTLNQYEDGDGTPYAHCDRCIDFEADCSDVNEEELECWLSGAGYGVWQEVWADTKTPEERMQRVRQTWEKEQERETGTP